LADGKSLSLKEMVRRSGNTPRTIRFYEEIGLIRPFGRTPGGHRLYHAAELEKLQLVSDLREAGLSLEEIKTMLDLKAEIGDARRCSVEVTKLLNTKIDELKRRLGVLLRLKEEFSDTVDVLQAACAECKHPPGQELCQACTDVNHQSLPRTFRWLWNVH
jgi:DNA-binding transcriptional MerR regulator